MDWKEKVDRWKGRLESPVVRKYGKVLHIVVWDHALMSYELAYVMAKHKKKKVMLLNGDLFHPFISDMSRTDATLHEPHSTLHPMDLTGLHLMLADVSAGKREKKMIHRYMNRHPKADSLAMLTGNYRPENAEFIEGATYEKVVELLKDEFDVLVENVASNLYDEIACRAILESDMVLFPFRMTLSRIRAVHQWALFLEQYQGFDMRKAQLVAYDYPYRWKLRLKNAVEMSQLTLLGTVPMESKRDRHLLSGDLYLPGFRKKRAIKKMIRKMHKGWL